MSGLSNLGLADPFVTLNGIDLSRGDLRAPTPSQEAFSEGFDTPTFPMPDTWATEAELHAAFLIDWTPVDQVAAVPLPASLLLLVGALVALRWVK